MVCQMEMEQVWLQPSRTKMVHKDYSSEMERPPDFIPGAKMD